jgi:hypothetical protein
VVDILRTRDRFGEGVECVQHFGDAEEHAALCHGFFDATKDDSTFCRGSSFNGCFVDFDDSWTEISGGKGGGLKQ